MRLDIHHKLFSYAVGTMKRQKNYVFAIGGFLDHIHLAVDMHATVSMADLVKNLKNSMSILIKREGLINGFEGWSKGYFAESVNPRTLGGLKSYIKNQLPHHMNVSFEDEMREIYQKYGLPYDPEED